MYPIILQLLLLAWLTVTPAAAADNSALNHCVPFTSTQLRSTVSRTLRANPANWTDVIKQAREGDEVIMDNGLYPLNQYAVVFDKPVTLRSASGNPGDVIIEGKGNRVPAEALMIMADNVKIADISIRNTRDHAIAIKQGVAGTFLYNLDLLDNTTAHIKGSKLNGDGTIACSRMGFSGSGSEGDYNGAIDLHLAHGWHIRDNYIYNIWGDGTGCFINTDCGLYEPGGGPAILLWKGSGDNIVERNVIVNSFRAISLGLGTRYDGGIVRDNLIINTEAGRPGPEKFIPSDSGISLLSANGVLVERNTILMNHDYRGQIEVKDGTDNIIRENLLSKPVWDRGNAEFNGCGSATTNTCSKETTNLILNQKEYTELLQTTAETLNNSLYSLLPGSQK